MLLWTFVYDIVQALVCNIKHTGTIWPSNPTLGHTPWINGNWSSLKTQYTNIYSSSIRNRPPNWKHPKCPSAGNQRLRYIHTMGYYSARKKDPPLHTHLERLSKALRWLKEVSFRGLPSGGFHLHNILERPNYSKDRLWRVERCSVATKE